MMTQSMQITCTTQGATRYGFKRARMSWKNVINLEGGSSLTFASVQEDGPRPRSGSRCLPAAQSTTVSPQQSGGTREEWLTSRRRVSSSNQQPKLPNEQLVWHSKGKLPVWVQLDTEAAGAAEANRWTFESAFERDQPDRFIREENWRQQNRQNTVLDLPPAPHMVKQLPQDLQPALLTNAAILIDKPLGWDTEEVTRSVQWACKVRRLGHAGALDCLASGLVVLLLGDATRFTSMLNALPREFSGIIRLGLATHTRDAAGHGLAALPWRHITDADIQRVAASFMGELMLVPPLASASRIDNGVPTYLATPPDLTPKPAYVQHFSVWREPGSKDLRFRMATTTSGSVVRSIAHDFGRLNADYDVARRALGTCAHIAQLRREAVGWLRVDEAWTLDALLPTMRKTRANAARQRR